MLYIFFCQIVSLGINLGCQFLFVALDGGLFVFGLKDFLSKLVKQEILLGAGVVAPLLKFVLNYSILLRGELISRECSRNTEDHLELLHDPGRGGGGVHEDEAQTPRGLSHSEPGLSLKILIILF